MAIALKQGTNGNLQRFEAADPIEVNALAARTTSSPITIGANLDAGQTVDIGAANVDTSILRDLFLARDILPGAGAGSLGSGVTQYVDEAWVQAVNDNGPDADAYNLNASGTSAGAYSIGVDPSLVSQSSETDLMTMLADISAAIAGAGVAQDTLPIENGVTIAAGDVVALSQTTTGRVVLADAASGGSQNLSVVGIASTGGTGDAGGTVNCTFTLLGNAEDAGSGLSAGAAVFVPVGGGAPTSTAPSTTGQAVMRVGWATTATRIYIETGPPLVL